MWKIWSGIWGFGGGFWGGKVCFWADIKSWVAKRGEFLGHFLRKVRYFLPNFYPVLYCFYTIFSFFFVLRYNGFNGCKDCIDLRELFESGDSNDFGFAILDFGLSKKRLGDEGIKKSKIKDQKAKLQSKNQKCFFQQRPVPISQSFAGGQEGLNLEIRSMKYEVRNKHKIRNPND
ncbi:MAG: hypothetical protein ABIG61_11955 [Planctomycetota bacterium]